jgi:transposase-like protein
MKNRYSKGAHVSEARFREVIRFFAADLPSLTAAELTGLNYRLLKLRSIRKEKFLTHLKECEWRWNHRHRKIYPILLKHLRQYPFSTT